MNDMLREYIEAVVKNPQTVGSFVEKHSNYTGPMNIVTFSTKLDTLRNRISWSSKIGFGIASCHQDFGNYIFINNGTTIRTTCDGASEINLSGEIYKGESNIAFIECRNNEDTRKRAKDIHSALKEYLSTLHPSNSKPKIVS